MGLVRCSSSLFIYIFNFVDVVAAFACLASGSFICAKHYAPPWLWITVLSERGSSRIRTASLSPPGKVAISRRARPPSASRRLHVPARVLQLLRHGKSSRSPYTLHSVRCSLLLRNLWNQRGFLSAGQQQYVHQGRASAKLLSRGRECSSHALA